MTLFFVSFDELAQNNKKANSFLSGHRGGSGENLQVCNICNNEIVEGESAISITVAGIVHSRYLHTHIYSSRYLHTHIYSSRYLHTYDGRYITVLSL
jgi:hypothetical protein